MLSRFLTSHKLAEELGCTVSSIYNHIHKKNFNAIPRPIRLGRKLVWTREAVEEWLQNKLEQTEESQPASESKPVAKIGRPTKKEQRSRRVKEEPVQR
jgi:Predicted transcriptional regulator